MDSRIANTKLVCKLKELQDSLSNLEKEKDAAVRDSLTAKKGQQAAERTLKDVKAEHKANIETRVSSYATLQAQVTGLADHNEQMQKQAKQHAAELAAVLEHRSQRHLDLKAEHAQTQQQLQAKCDECLKLYKQLEGQTHVISTIEEELRAVRADFTSIEKAVACNERREQLEAQANDKVQLKDQKDNLQKELLTKEMALQTTLKEVKVRDETDRVLIEEKQAAEHSLHQATQRHTGLLDQLQASNDLVQTLSDTCRQQLQTLDNLKQDMTSSHVADMQRHDKQEHTMTVMRRTKVELRQTVQELQQRCAVMERSPLCHTPSGSQQYAAAACYGSPLHPHNSAPVTGPLASHAEAATNGQQQHTTPSREGPSFTPTAVGPWLPSHSSASKPAQPACLSAYLSTAAEPHHDTQTNSAAAPVPMTLLPVLPPTTQQQSLSRAPAAAPTAATPAAVAAPPTGAVIPDFGQAHASAEQTLSPQPAVDSMLPGQQQQTSRECKSIVSAIADLSELELDADTATGVSSTVEAVPQPQSASQKRLTCQAPLDLTSPTIPSAKKHKVDDGSTSASTADRSSAQLAKSAAKPQQPVKPPLTTIQLAVATTTSPDSGVYPSMHTMASIPPHEHSQKAVTVPTVSTEATETVATKTTLPQCPHAAASEADSVLFNAPQELVLSMPASCTSSSTTAALVTVSCHLPAALSSAAAQQLLGTAATANTSPAGKNLSSQPSVAMLSRSLVTFHAHPNPMLPSDLRAFSKQGPSSYQPVIKELPPDLCPTAPTTISAAANKSLPSKPAMVIDIDSDDDHKVTANNQPAASLQDRQGQDDKLAQSHGSTAKLNFKPAMLRDHASEAKSAVNRQTNPGLYPTPKAATTPFYNIAQATAVQTSFNQSSAAMGMGHIFSSFSMFEELSDAEEEDAGAESAAAVSRAAGQLQHAGPTGSCRTAQLPAASSSMHQPHVQPPRSSAAMEMPGQPIAAQLAGRQAGTPAGSCVKCSEPDFGYMPCCNSCNTKYHALCVSAPFSGSHFMCEHCRMQFACNSKKLKAVIGRKR